MLSSEESGERLRERTSREGNQLIALYSESAAWLIRNRSSILLLRSRGKPWTEWVSADGMGWDGPTEIVTFVKHRHVVPWSYHAQKTQPNAPTSEQQFCVTGRFPGQKHSSYNNTNGDTKKATRKGLHLSASKTRSLQAEVGTSACFCKETILFRLALIRPAFEQS